MADAEFSEQAAAAYRLNNNPSHMLIKKKE